MKKIINTLTWALSFVVFAAVTALVILYLKGVNPYIVLSGSMEPEIQTGSVCWINTKAPYGKLKTGDMIAFENGQGTLTTHRVIHISKEGLETKGDANKVSDGITTTKSNYKGKTLFSIPYIGYLLEYLHTRKGIFLLVFVVSAFAVFQLIFKRKERMDERT